MYHMAIKILLLNLPRDHTKPSKSFFNTGNFPMTNKNLNISLIQEISLWSMKTWISL